MLNTKQPIINLNNENDEDFSNRKLNTFWKLRRII